MRTVWKYPLSHTSECQWIEMPEGSVILCAKVQHGVICVWAEVETAAPMKNRCIEIVGTGHTMDVAPSFERKYIGTVFICGGQFVWHVYERT